MNVTATNRIRFRFFTWWNKNSNDSGPALQFLQIHSSSFGSEDKFNATNALQPAYCDALDLGKFGYCTSWNYLFPKAPEGDFMGRSPSHNFYLNQILIDILQSVHLITGSHLMLKEIIWFWILDVFLKYRVFMLSTHTILHLTVSQPKMYVSVFRNGTTRIKKLSYLNKM